MDEKERIEQLRDILTLNVVLPIKQHERELKRIKRLQIYTIFLMVVVLAAVLPLTAAFIFNLQIN